MDVFSAEICVSWCLMSVVEVHEKKVHALGGLVRDSVFSSELIYLVVRFL